MSENTPDLSGFDPANKELDPKLFIVERCLEMVQRIEKKNIQIWERLCDNDPGAAMKISMDIRFNLDYMGANGYLGRLQQHLTESATPHSKLPDKNECDDDDHHPEKVFKFLTATSSSELAALFSPVVRVFRLWPEHVVGFVQELPIPNSIPNIIETVGRNFGGGNYRIHIVDKEGNTLTTSLFQIAGKPKGDI